VRFTVSNNDNLQCANLLNNLNYTVDESVSNLSTEACGKFGNNANLMIVDTDIEMNYYLSNSIYWSINSLPISGIVSGSSMVFLMAQTKMYYTIKNDSVCEAYKSQNVEDILSLIGNFFDSTTAFACFGGFCPCLAVILSVWFFFCVYVDPITNQEVPIPNQEVINFNSYLLWIATIPIAVSFGFATSYKASFDPIAQKWMNLAYYDCFESENINNVFFEFLNYCNALNTMYDYTLALLIVSALNIVVSFLFYNF